MYPLAQFLRSKNYDVRHWGLGTNKGEIYDYVELIGAGLKAENGPRITLIGWSLGGVVAREVARLYEPHVREIITMGTPVIGGPKYTIVGDRFAKAQDLDLDEYEAYVHSVNSIGLTQPITAFYSKRDGIVGWQAAVDTYNEQARNIEVDTTHLGIGINAKVWIEIAETLAAS
jgi:pimeloyl-ACP methyl ester carboxylesterase